VFSAAGQNRSVTNDPVIKPMPSTSTGFAKVLSWRDEIGITGSPSLTNKRKVNPARSFLPGLITLPTWES
ncbi:MAG: hypothetical protein EBT02_15015, partial [Planctomycetia bacterium]|jgi:hypothetical protein|nr:hypothetical protein [Planctomycetia bacterium]